MAKYIEANGSAAVVFSGHHGDSVWDANIPTKALEEIRVPRRIAEEAGVGRCLFGIEKKFVASKYMLPINLDLRKLFLEYLQAEHHIHPTTIYLDHIFNLLSKVCQSVALHKGKRQSSNISGNYLLGKDIDLYFFMSIWATIRLSEKIARILSQKTFQ